MIDYRLTLDYNLHPGWMTPYISGLQSGKAVARACKDCEHVSFPPARVCACGGRDGDWRKLAGTAQIELRTDGTDGAFGLVAFDGASTKTVVRLVGLDPTETRGKLVASKGDLPALCLAPMVQETTS